MFELIFGIIWTLFSSIFVFVTFISEDVPLLFKFMMCIFLIIGIIMIIKGLQKVIKNMKTNNYGEICYGYIQNVYPDGSYVNGMPEYKADILTYIPSTNSTETISEIIGFNPMKYPTDSYVIGKYYEGDINLEEIVNNFEQLPINVQNCFSNIEEEKKKIEDIVVINGVRYKRIEEDNNKQ